MKTRRKLSKNCPKNCSIHGKYREISGPYNFLKPIKAMCLIFETETVGPCFVRKLNWGAMAHLAPPSGANFKILTITNVTMYFNFSINFYIGA